MNEVSLQKQYDSVISTSKELKAKKRLEEQPLELKF